MRNNINFLNIEQTKDLTLFFHIIERYKEKLEQQKVIIPTNSIPDSQLVTSGNFTSTESALIKHLQTKQHSSAFDMLLTSASISTLNWALSNREFSSFIINWSHHNDRDSGQEACKQLISTFTNAASCSCPTC